MRAIRVPRPSHATVVAYLALFVAMSGTAVATTGGAFILGQDNTASRTSTLTSRAGAPLSLDAAPGAAPMRVDSTKRVARLNADLLDGRHSSSFLRSLCPLGQGSTRRNPCTSTYMRHVPITQPTLPNGTIDVNSAGMGTASCENAATVGGGFVLGGPADRLDIVRASSPHTPVFRPRGWRVVLEPNPLNNGLIQPGSFAYAVCLKGTELP
jgi:hypothetical protein